MAFIKRYVVEDEYNLEFLLVSYSVGASSANWWTDIQLVQYLISYIYSFADFNGATEWQQKMSKNELDNLPNPNNDFKKLSKTTALIKRFQEDTNVQGKFKVYPDGRIDRTNGDLSSITKTTYTIDAANYYFDQLVRNTLGVDNSVEWALKDTYMPTMLKGQLLTNLDIE